MAVKNIQTGLCSSAKWPGECNVAACGRTSAASLCTGLHCFAFVFPAFGGAGLAELGTYCADAVSEGRTSHKQHCAGAAKFQAFPAKSDAFRHCLWVHGQTFIAAFRTPAYAVQTVFDTLLNKWI